MLATEGFDLLMAPGGEEALAMVQASAPDLILLDVMMPQMSGLQVATAIKTNPRTKTIPVIMVTAYDDPVTKTACLVAGAEDFLTKPVNRIELCMRVRNLLRLHEAIADANRARVQAERANSAKTQFLRAVTHELRTPLHAISGYTEILEIGIRGAVNPAQSKDLGRIKQASNHLLHLVDDVLTVARLEGARPLVPVPVGVTALCEDAKGICEASAAAKKITLAVSCTRDVLVIADRQRFEQILVNLISNTLEFCARGGAVSITCDHDAAMARIVVGETTSGARARVTDHVFAPFSEIDMEAGSAPQQAIGLGLSMSRELARAMGGDVTLEGVQGAGATFTLSLPIAPVSVAAPPLPGATQPVGKYALA
jgi:signal transduction histidine kinase